MRCFRTASAVVLLLGGAAVAVGAEAGRAEGDRVDFVRDVAPIFERNCLRCHGAADPKGDFSVATADAVTRSGAIAPGDAAASSLLDLVASADGARPAMPKAGRPLSAEEVDLLRRWVAEGAVWPAGVVLKDSPKGDASWWSLRPVVSAPPPSPAGLTEGWDANPIDRFVFAGLAAKGLTPNPPADRAAMIRRLTYDLTGLPPTPEEITAFVADGDPLAYDRLVDRLLASPRYGERWGRHWLDVVRFGESNGFERNVVIDTLWPFRDAVIASFDADKPFDRLVREHLAGDVVGAGDPAAEIGTAFLVCGPYDDVGNQDAAAAAAIRADAVDEMLRATAEGFLGLTVGCARCHDHKFDPVTQKDYYALSAAFAGVTHGPRPVGAAVSWPAGSWWAGNFGPAGGSTRVFLGGDPQRPGDEVVPASLSALDPLPSRYSLPADAPGPDRRAALAEWVVAADNPLTARVLANRLWHFHFGTGIVDTPSDFGAMGGEPTHPELLDFLASELHRQGWRLKPLHRLIVTSQAYRQSAAYRAEAAAVDAAARSLWRFPPRRLDGEEVRDTLLAVAGVLNERRGGPGFRLYRYEQDNVATYVPLDDHGSETYRRAVYHQTARAAPVDVLGDFDCPDPAFAAPRRPATTTPMQALTLMNHRFPLAMAGALAGRLRAEAGGDPAAQVRRGFALAYGRDPAADELAAATALAAAHGLPAFCRAVLNSNELIYLR